MSMQAPVTRNQLTTEAQRHRVINVSLCLLCLSQKSLCVSVSLWFALALTVVVGIRAQSQDWPQFLGPNRNGSIDVTLPAAPKLVEAWRKPVGAGMSAVTVARGRAFTLYTDDVDDYLLALDATTGAGVWKAKLGKTHDDTVTSGPGSTPAVAGDLVVALGSSCRLQAFAVADGKPAWEVDVAVAYKSRFATRGGCSISPVVYGNLIVLPTGATDGERLVALDAATGKPVWSAKGVERSINTNPSVLGIDLGCAAPLPLCESAGEVWYRRCESQGRFDRMVSRR